MRPIHWKEEGAVADAVWGIDLGGTKIEGVVLPASASVEALCRIRRPTEAERGYDHLRGQIRELVEAMEREVWQRPETIGIGTPGVLDPETLRLKNSNTACLIGQPLKADLEAELGVPIELANDANCFALAEARLGAARGTESCFGVIMGTGVGGGVVDDGRALLGCQGIAGEWGHNILDSAGPDCYCGRKGCVETFISGPASNVSTRSSTARPHRCRRLSPDLRAALTPMPGQQWKDLSRTSAKPWRLSSTSSTPMPSSWAAASAMSISSIREGSRR